MPPKKLAAASKSSGRIAKRPAAANTEGQPRQKVRAKGLFPEKIFEEMLAIMSEKRRRDLKNALTRKPWSMSSACSGSGMAEVSWVFLHNTFAIPARVAFSCESVKWKQRFLTAVLHDKVSLVPGCMFGDLCTLRTGTTSCAAHGKECDVPKHSDLFICGFSCKDLSTKNSKLTPLQRKHILADKSGSSGQTFDGIITHIMQARPLCILLENVDAILHPSAADNLDYLWSSLSQVGYAGASKVFKSSEYGLPQERSRVFFIVLDCAALGYTTADARTKAFEMLDYSEVFQVEPRPVTDFLLRPEDSKLSAELQRRKDCVLGDKQSSWRETHKEFFKTKGINYAHIKPGAELLSNEWFNILPAREKEALCYGLFAKPLRDMAESLCVVDVAPRIDRINCSYDYTLPTLTPTSKLWLNRCAKKDGKMNATPARFFIGWEAMQAQGYPMHWLKNIDVTDCQMADLAGNAFSSTILFAIQASIVINLDRSKVNRPEEDGLHMMESIIDRLGFMDDSDKDA